MPDDRITTEPAPDQRITTDSAPLRVNWTGSEILLGVFLAWFFWPSVVSAVLKGIGFEAWYYGENAADVSLRMSLWVRTLACPLQVLTFPLLFAALSGTRPVQLGLTTRRLGRSALAGAAGALVLTPAVVGLYLLLQFLYGQAGEGAVEKHPLEALPLRQLAPGEWVMVALLPMVAAPALEELSFRGVLQPWLAERRWAGPVVVGGALAAAVMYRWDAMVAEWAGGIGPLAVAATPVLFVLGLVPIYLLVWWRSHAPMAPAIFASSLLFASIHANVCLAPIPLFVLSVGLGALAARTSSLAGPIVLHGLFNAVAFVQLLLER